MSPSRRHILTTAAAVTAASTLPDFATPPTAAAGPPIGTGGDLCARSAAELLALMRARKVSPTEVARAHLDRIDALNPDINAFVYREPDEQVLARARESEARYLTGRPLPLDGLPFGVKDLFDFWKGRPNTFGSVPLQRLGFVPPVTAVYIQWVLDAGANPLGKTNTPEFGHKGTTDNFVFGPTRSPWDLAMNAGGSSGGSAAAVAAGMVPLAQGSDAGGSVRIPAALTGTVGMTPTHGRIPEDYPPARHSPYLTPGPMARTVRDTALLMDVMARPFSRDPASLPDTVHYAHNLTGNIRGARIAYSPNLDLYPVEAAVTTVVRDALDAFRDAGAHVEQINLGLNRLRLRTESGVVGQPVTHADLTDLWLMYQSVLYAHGRELFLGDNIIDLMADGNREELTPQFRAMIERGERTSAVAYRRGDFLRTDLTHALEDVLADYDYIVTPTLAVLCVPNASDGNTLGPTEVNGVPVDPQIGWCLTPITNLTGHPSISVPAGRHGNHPVGMQIIGRRWNDLGVLNAALAVQKHRPWPHI